MGKKTVTLLIILIFILYGTVETYAQFNKRRGQPSGRPDRTSTFLDTQWWLGLKTGVNFSEAVPEQRYAVFSSVNYAASALDKTYNNYKKMGMQAGIEVTFYHKGFSFSLQPNYRRQSFGYENQYTWTNPEVADRELVLHYTQEVNLDYMEIPLFIKYDILRRAKVRPFIQIGAYYAMLVGAEKAVQISGMNHASGGMNEFEGESLYVGAEDLFIRSSAGLLGGAGINYDLWKIRVIFDIVYRYGLHNISNAQNRYANNRLSGLGDTMDDITLNNLSFNLGFLFPLRFISQDFNAVQ